MTAVTDEEFHTATVLQALEAAYGSFVLAVDSAAALEAIALDADNEDVAWKYVLIQDFIANLATDLRDAFTDKEAEEG